MQRNSDAGYCRADRAPPLVRLEFPQR